MPNKLALQMNGRYFEIPLWDINVLEKEDEKTWTCQVTESDLVRAVMEPYEGFRQFVRISEEEAANEYIRIQQDYVRKNSELTKKFEEAMDSLKKQSHDLEKLRTIMGETK